MKKSKTSRTTETTGLLDSAFGIKTFKTDKQHGRHVHTGHGFSRAGSVKAAERKIRDHQRNSKHR